MIGVKLGLKEPVLTCKRVGVACGRIWIVLFFRNIGSSFYFVLKK